MNLYTALLKIPDASPVKLELVKCLLPFVEREADPFTYGSLHFTIGYLQSQHKVNTDIPEAVQHFREARDVFKAGGWDKECTEVERLLKRMENNFLENREGEEADNDIDDANSGMRLEDRLWEGWIGKVVSGQENKASRTFLGKTGRRENEVERVNSKGEQDIKFTKDALLVYTKEESPEEHARLSNNLGVLLHARFGTSHRVEVLQEAIQHFDIAVTWFSNAAGSYQEDERATTFKNAASALIDVDSATSLDRAIQLISSARQVFASERCPTESVECQMLEATATLRKAIVIGFKTDRAGKLARTALALCDQALRALSSQYGDTSKKLERRVSTLRADALSLIAIKGTRVTIENAIDAWELVARKATSLTAKDPEEAARSKFQLGRLFEMRHTRFRSDLDSSLNLALTYFLDSANWMWRAASSRIDVVDRERLELAWAVIICAASRITSELASRKYQVGRDAMLLLEQSLEKARYILSQGTQLDNF